LYFEIEPMNDPLTVVILNDFAHVQGGASKVAIDEAVSLAESGITVIFLSAVGPVGPELQGACVETRCLNQPQLLDFRKTPGVALQSIWNPTAKRQLQDRLMTLDPDRTVVHLHGYSKALSVSPIAAARAMGFRVVCTLHDYFAACPNGAFFDYVQMRPCTRTALYPSCLRANCDKRKMSHKAFRVVRTAAQRYVGHFPHNVHHFITLSAHSANLMRPYLPLNARCYSLRNVTDVARRPPAKVRKNRTILYVGRLDEEKGVRLLTEAASACGVDLLLVGDGPLRSEIEICSRVTVTGWLSPSEVAARLDEARCLVFPSLWQETFGLVVDEAAARGVPSVVSDITAAAERVQDGKTGWHFRSGDVTALITALRRTDSDEAVELAGSAAYQAYWQNPPTRPAHASSLIEIYHGMLASAA
jgi:glycosyltransferase involved in cell wall biosynthesis